MDRRYSRRLTRGGRPFFYFNRFVLLGALGAAVLLSLGYGLSADGSHAVGNSNATTPVSSGQSAPSANSSQTAQFVLSNERLKAEFGDRGLLSIQDTITGRKLEFSGDSFSLTLSGETISSQSFFSSEVTTTAASLTYDFASGPYTIKLVYQMKPGWGFVSKQVMISKTRGPDFRVDKVEAFSASLANATAAGSELLLKDGSYGALLRFPDAKNPLLEAVRWGAFFLVQNPFMIWKKDGQRLSISYLPDMDWKNEYGPFATDRVCIGIYELSGTRFPAKTIPEWKYVPDYQKHLAQNPLIDSAEVDALTDCVRAFVLARPSRGTRIHVPWCENDYQVDVATPEGLEEYKRIIDRASELGCNYTLYTPANSALSSLSENADGWGWENLLWFALGQKVRKGEWDPRADAVPEPVMQMIDYGRTKGLKYLAYVYPSLAFKQDPEWTKWAGDKVGGYNGADTGRRSFQDWLLENLTAFQRKTGAGGFAFDHWFIAYGNASSKYAQWYGCRRILESLRGEVPDIVIDGRQSYQNYGPWTWLAGSYPHPTSTDEQPESFVAFPDLHTDRVSADRQRYAAWRYRVEGFCPPEIMPGFITHQSERSDEKEVMRRDRFRPRDWDYLGWRYSLLSSIATAPFNHVVNMIPARDPDEFRLFPEADKQWFRAWLDWADQNGEFLRQTKFIIGQPMVGRVDGTSAIVNDSGYIFLFNPNYRALPAEFVLDKSIGLQKEDQFLLREIYPESGKLIGCPKKGFWDFGEKVSIRIGGAQALVLGITPAPTQLKEPLLFNVPGKAVLRYNRVDITGVRGEVGTDTEILVMLPESKAISSLKVNEIIIAHGRKQNIVTARFRFSGTRFSQCQQVGVYDSAFNGGSMRARFTIPERIFKQLRERKAKWPVPYTPDDLRAPWLGPHRLLLFVQVAEPSHMQDAVLKIDGEPVELKRAYNSVYPHAPEKTFLGWYANVSNFRPDRNYAVELIMPPLAPGQFQGLFFENVETEYTDSITQARASGPAAAPARAKKTR